MEELGGEWNRGACCDIPKESVKHYVSLKKISKVT